MKDKLIETIKAVPITGKTYGEYVEAIAEKLIAEVVFPPYVRMESKALPVILNVKYKEDGE